MFGERRISGPAELLQAVPYLLGFRPESSLVLVGLHESALVVTARIDLDDAAGSGAIAHTVGAMTRGGSTEIVAVVHDDAAEPDPDPRVRLPWSQVADEVDEVAFAADCLVVDLLLVAGVRWWSYTCGDPGCCPRSGRTLLAEPTPFAAAATVAGVAVLPDRGTLAAQLDPVPEPEQARLAPLLEQEEHEVVAAVLAAGSQRRERSVKRAIFAAARASDEPRWSGLDDLEVARFGVALSGERVRDAVWFAIDEDRLDGQPLWRALATRLPPPYRAGPLLLLGWWAWRHGDGALARIAAERALAADPEFTSADLLTAALTYGLNPRRSRPLRRSRSA